MTQGRRLRRNRERGGDEREDNATHEGVVDDMCWREIKQDE